jgi:hypothetical protein
MENSLFDTKKIEEQIKKHESEENGYNIGVYENEECYTYCLAKNYAGQITILLSKMAFSENEKYQLKEDVAILQRIFNAKIFEEIH